MLSRHQHIMGEVNPLDILTVTGWTHQKLAEALDVSISTVDKWSAGRRNPSGRIRRQAAELLSILQKGDAVSPL